MPIVLVQYKAGRNLEVTAKMLALKMPEIVASALDVSEQEGDAGRLVPDDIEVWCNESGKLDVNTKEFEIIIWAHDFPSRKATLEQRKDKIIQGVRGVIGFTPGWCPPNTSGFVWVLLQPTAFGIL